MSRADWCVVACPACHSTRFGVWQARRGGAVQVACERCEALLLESELVDASPPPGTQVPSGRQPV